MLYPLITLSWMVAPNGQERNYKLALLLLYMQMPCVLPCVSLAVVEGIIWKRTMQDKT